MAYENSANSGLFDRRIFTTFFSFCLLCLIVSYCFLFPVSDVLCAVFCMLFL